MHFEPGNFTCWGSEWVKTKSLIFSFVVVVVFVCLISSLCWTKDVLKRLVLLKHIAIQTQDVWLLLFFLLWTLHLELIPP